jgi:hypothetical protein
MTMQHDSRGGRFLCRKIVARIPAAYIAAAELRESICARPGRHRAQAAQHDGYNDQTVK